MTAKASRPTFVPPVKPGFSSPAVAWRWTRWSPISLPVPPNRCRRPTRPIIGYHRGAGFALPSGLRGCDAGLLHGSATGRLGVVPRSHSQGDQRLSAHTHRGPKEALAPYLSAARLTNPAVRFVGISLNTSSLNEADARVLLHNTANPGPALRRSDPQRSGFDRGRPGDIRCPLIRPVR